jgi:hypothetical protein
MFMLAEATRVQGRIAILLLAGTSLILWAPSWLEGGLHLTNLRSASYFWVVGVVFLAALGLAIVRFVEVLVAARREYKANDHFREQLRRRTSQEIALLEELRKAGRTTAFLHPGKLPEIQPLTALGFLEEVQPPEAPFGSHGIYLVPLPIMKILDHEYRKNNRDLSVLGVLFDPFRFALDAFGGALDPSRSLSLTLPALKQQIKLAGQLTEQLNEFSRVKILSRESSDENLDDASSSK